MRVSEFDGVSVAVDLADVDADVYVARVCDRDFSPVEEPVADDIVERTAD